MTPNARFLELLQDIEPSPTTKADAKSAHEKVRGYLRNHDTYKDRHIKTFLSGSYKRDTAIRPRRENGVLTRPDVDIIVVTDYTLEDCPKDVVNELYDALEDGYDEIEKQARSVNICTSKAEMDVVSIIEPYGEGGGLYIPDRELVEWLPTNPPGHTTWTTTTNDRAGKRFKPLVKLIKWWRRHNPTTGRHPKGFILECITAECMDYTETHYGKLFTDLLETIVSRYAISVQLGEVPWINDPGVPGNSVTSKVTFKDFKSFYDVVVDHAEKAKEALYEEDPDRMTELWREIFGSRFPKTSVSKAENGLLSKAVQGTPLLQFPDRPVQPKKPAGFA